MVLGPLLLAGFGYLIVWLAGRNTKRQRRLIEESSPVDAVITGSRLGTVTPEPDGKYNSTTAHVTFEYEYGGEQYQSTHIRPGGTKFGSLSGATARRRANRYDVGDEVTAHVPESDPRLGFLEKKTSGRAHRVLRLFGWGITAFGLLLAVILAVL